jgi:hypothetical protein
MLNQMVKLTEELSGLVETAEIMSNKKLMASIKRARNDVKKGRLHRLKNIDELWK